MGVSGLYPHGDFPISAHRGHAIWPARQPCRDPNGRPFVRLGWVVSTPRRIWARLSFTSPLVFQWDGYLLVEHSSRSGILVRVEGPLVTRPADPYHRARAEAYNRALVAYSSPRHRPPDQRLWVEHAADPYRRRRLARVAAYLHGVPGGRVCATNCCGRQRTPLPLHRRRHHQRDRPPGRS